MAHIPSGNNKGGNIVVADCYVAPKPPDPPPPHDFTGGTPWWPPDVVDPDDPVIPVDPDGPMPDAECECFMEKVSHRFWPLSPPPAGCQKAWRHQWTITYTCKDALDPNSKHKGPTPDPFFWLTDLIECAHGNPAHNCCAPDRVLAGSGKITNPTTANQDCKDPKKQTCILPCPTTVVEYTCCEEKIVDPEGDCVCIMGEVIDGGSEPQSATLECIGGIIKYTKYIQQECEFVATGAKPHHNAEAVALLKDCSGAGMDCSPGETLECWVKGEAGENCCVELKKRAVECPSTEFDPPCADTGFDCPEIKVSWTCCLNDAYTYPTGGLPGMVDPPGVVIPPVRPEPDPNMGIINNNQVATVDPDDNRVSKVPLDINNNMPVTPVNLNLPPRVIGGLANAGNQPLDPQPGGPSMGQIITYILSRCWFGGDIIPGSTEPKTQFRKMPSSFKKNIDSKLNLSAYKDPALLRLVNSFTPTDKFIDPHEIFLKVIQTPIAELISMLGKDYKPFNGTTISFHLLALNEHTLKVLLSDSVNRYLEQIDKYNITKFNLSSNLLETIKQAILQGKLKEYPHQFFLDIIKSGRSYFPNGFPRPQPLAISQTLDKNLVNNYLLQSGKSLLPLNYPESGNMMRDTAKYYLLPEFIGLVLPVLPRGEVSNPYDNFVPVRFSNTNSINVVKQGETLSPW